MDYSELSKDTLTPPNKSPEPTAVGRFSSAFAVHAASRRWFSFLRWAKMTPDFMKRGLLIAWIAVALFGLALVGWAFWFQCRGGSYLAIPEIVGFVGIYVAFQGIANVRRITKEDAPQINTPNTSLEPL